MVVVCMSSTYNIYMVYPVVAAAEKWTKCSICLLSWPHTERVEKWCFRFQYSRVSSRKIKINSNYRTRLKKNMSRTQNETPRGKSRCCRRWAAWQKHEQYTSGSTPNQFQQCKSHQFMRGCTKYIFIPHIILLVFVYFLMAAGIIVFFILQICGVFSFLEKCHLLCNK